MDQDKPTVAVLMPCFNERDYIRACLDSLLDNDYPKDRLEIVVIDGMSDDGTRDIVAQYAAKHPHIRLLDNPARLKSNGLNTAIRDTDSEVVIRVDSHAVYASDYIGRLVADLDEYDADNTGGVRETHLADSPIARSIGVSVSHWFAAANAHWRTGTDRVRVVDTVFGGCYRRKVFDRIGLFNEHLIRTQDREFNRRLTDDGGVIVLDPSVRCTYFPRKHVSQHWNWTYDGAYWVFYARRFTTAPMISWRNTVPLAFVAWHLLSVIATGISVSLAPWVWAPIALYWVLNLGLSAREGWQHRSLAFVPAMSLAFAVTHYGYGLGGWMGLYKAAVEGRHE